MIGEIIAILLAVTVSWGLWYCIPMDNRESMVSPSAKRKLQWWRSYNLGHKKYKFLIDGDIMDVVHKIEDHQRIFENQSTF